MFRTIAILFFVLIAVTAAAVEFVPLTLNELFKESTLVVRGKVVELEPPCPECESTWARVQVTKFFKSTDVQAKEISVVAKVSKGSSDFRSGDEVVLFLRPWKQGYAPVSGYLGIVPLSKGYADSRFIKKLPKRMTEKNFLDAMDSSARKTANKPSEVTQRKN